MQTFVTFDVSASVPLVVNIFAAGGHGAYPEFFVPFDTSFCPRAAYDFHLRGQNSHCLDVGCVSCGLIWPPSGFLHPQIHLNIQNHRRFPPHLPQMFHVRDVHDDEGYPFAVV